MCNLIKSVLFALIELNLRKRSMTKVPYSQYGNTTDFRNRLNFSEDRQYSKIHGKNRLHYDSN